MPTKAWSVQHKGRTIEVQNYWNILLWSRTSLYVDGGLIDEAQGFGQASARLVASIEDESGRKVEFKALVGQGFLGLTMACKIWVDSHLVYPSQAGTH